MLNTFLVEESLSGGENTVLGRGREKRKANGAVPTEHQPSLGSVSCIGVAHAWCKITL